MKLEDISMKDLLIMRNKISDKPAGPKTFSTRDKLVGRIKAIIVNKNIDLAGLWPRSAAEMTTPGGSAKAETAEASDALLPGKMRRDKGVGALARQLLLDPEGHPHKLIAAMVNAQLDGARATDNSIRWYANDMRKKGIDVPARKKTRSAHIDTE